MSPIDTSKKLYVFFQVVIMNRQNIRACGTPPNIPTDCQMTEHFFSERNYELFLRNCYLLFLSASTLYMHPHVSGTERVGFLKARCSWEPGSQNSDICVRTWNLVHGDSQIRQNLNLRVKTWNPVQPLNFPFSAFCGRCLLWRSVGRNYHSYQWPYDCMFFFFRL